jgi:hypothetical protein
LVGIPSRYLQKKDFGYRAGFLAGDRKAKKLFAPGVKSGPFTIQPGEEVPSRFIASGRWAIFRVQEASSFV